MEVKRLEESYRINGNDDFGLIPEGTYIVFVKYSDNGKVEGIFYAPNADKRIEESFQQHQKRLDEEVTGLNSRSQTQEEIEKVAGLLKKMSSK